LKSKEQKYSLFTALAHPTRRRILRAMMDKEIHVIATPLKLSEDLEGQLSMVSYHIRILVKCKAIRLAQTKRVKGSTQHFYRLTLSAAWARDALETTKD